MKPTPFVVLLALAATASVATLAQQPSDGKLTVGTKDIIYYSGGATEAQAKALAEGLKAAGYFADTGINVMLRKGPDERLVIGYVVKESLWRADLLMNYESITRESVAGLGGLPMRIKILTGELDTLAESNVWPPVKVGEKDHVYASGMATMADAEKLGKALVDDGFLQNLGVGVYLYRDFANGVIISIPTRQKEKELSFQMAAFEFVVREVASSVGGLPVRLRLVDPDNLNVRRDLMVHPALRYGKNDTIYRSDGATRENADALAAVLRAKGVFNDEEAAVLLSKSNAGAVVSIIVNKGAWDKDEVVQFYKELGQAMAPAIGGLPIKVRLVSNGFEVKKELEIK